MRRVEDLYAEKDGEETRPCRKSLLTALRSGCYLIPCNHGSLHIPVYSVLSHLIRNNSAPSLMPLHVWMGSSFSLFHHLSTYSCLSPDFALYSAPSVSCFFHPHCFLHPLQPSVFTQSTPKCQSAPNANNQPMFSNPSKAFHTHTHHTDSNYQRHLHKPAGASRFIALWSGWRKVDRLEVFSARLPYRCLTECSFQERSGRHCGRWLF